MIKLGLEWNSEEKKAVTRNFTALHSIQCGINDKMFRLIASLPSTKEAWDTLHKFFKKLRSGDVKKEESYGTLKRVQSQVSREEDNGDQGKISRLRALTLNVITQGYCAKGGRDENKIVRLSSTSR